MSELDAAEQALAAERERRERAEQLLTNEEELRQREDEECVELERERDEAVQRAERAEADLMECGRHHVVCTSVGVEREADLRAERDEARAQVAALRETAQAFVSHHDDGQSGQPGFPRTYGELDVWQAEWDRRYDALRAALAAAPAAHVCREPALRNDLARLVAEYTRDGRCASCGDDVGACGCGVGRVRAALAGGADGEPAAS